MDDDIRNRFRGVSRPGPTPNAYGRTGRPAAAPQRQAARPAAKPAWPTSAPAQPKQAAQAQPRPAAPVKLPKPPKPPKKRKTRSKRFKRTRLVVILLLILALAGGSAYYVLTRNKKADQKFEQQLTTPQTTQTESPKPTGTIRFIAVGDSLAFESINNAAKQPDGSYNYLPMMAGFKPFFEKADIRLCNETTPAGGDTDGLAISAYPTFNAPTAWSTGFAGLGCNLINLASNHINDKGQTAINNTLKTWDEQKNVLAVAGANRSAEEQAKIRYFTVKGVKFAYLAYATKNANAQVSAFGVNMYSDELANKQIEEARKNAQLVIVSMNWGTEDSNDINADQDRIAQNLANQNADVIIGGGPHVVQPAKILNGKDGHQTLAWFSLGNFLNSELPVNNLIGGMAVMDFDAATGQIKDPKFLPVYMHYEWTAAQKAAGTINARHSFMLWPLDLAAAALAKSQNGTTVDAQTNRVTGIITKFAPIKVIKSTDF